MMKSSRCLARLSLLLALGLTPKAFGQNAEATDLWARWAEVPTTRDIPLLIALKEPGTGSQPAKWIVRLLGDQSNLEPMLRGKLQDWLRLRLRQGKGRPTGYDGLLRLTLEGPMLASVLGDRGLNGQTALRLRKLRRPESISVAAKTIKSATLEVTCREKDGMPQERPQESAYANCTGITELSIDLTNWLGAGAADEEDIALAWIGPSDPFTNETMRPLEFVPAPSVVSAAELEKELKSIHARNRYANAVSLRSEDCRQAGVGQAALLRCAAKYEYAVAEPRSTQEASLWTFFIRAENKSWIAGRPVFVGGLIADPSREKPFRDAVFGGTPLAGFGPVFILRKEPADFDCTSVLVLLFDRTGQLVQFRDRCIINSC